jgi:hypothetical protein
MGASNSSESKRFWLCPLYSFDAYSGNVELAEGIQIKAISVLPGLSDYIQRQSHDLYGQWDDPSEYNGVILLPYRARAIKGAGNANIKIGLEEQDRATNLLFDLITSLRLCHEGKITAGPLIYSGVDHDSEWSFGGTTIWTLVSKRDFLHQDPKYVLHQSDVPHVNELVGNLAKLRKLEKLDAINIALRRFNSAYHGYIEDRLIDQMIAFESLYLGDDKELTYKLALRAAFFLGKKKKQIFRDMKDAYKLRGDIVHASKKVDTDKLTEIIPKSEEYLRQSLRKFLYLLSKGMSFNEIRDQLDKNIFTNGRTLANS